jgi:hypothetical protein
MSPVFWSVTFCVLVDFNARLPKLTEFGDTTRFAKAVSPVPTKEIEPAFTTDSAETWTFAAAAPAEVGAKVNVYVRLLAGRTV